MRSLSSPLIGASVQLLPTRPAIGTTTNETGGYVLESVAVGRYQLRVSFIGYEQVIVQEVLVESGKEVVLDIQLLETATALDAIVVRASRDYQRGPAKLSNYRLSVEETRRFPATFNDPARLTLAYPGVANANDQANNLIIRGNAPGGMLWQLEGLEIVNPNHLSNAGTFSDRPAQNGGGVNILSAQMLGTSTFLTGAFPAGFGNALSGVMDMQLRKGNHSDTEFTAQAGLIGLELAAEGPLSKTSSASYLLNYRYSTIGLLTQLGVDFGEEAINFQDVAFHLALPTTGAGNFRIFGMGGKSENIFEAVRDTASWELEKDRFDIKATSKMGALGLVHQIGLSNKTVLHSAIVGSAFDTNRSGGRLTDELRSMLVELDQWTQSIFAVRTVLTTKLDRKP